MTQHSTIEGNSARPALDGLRVDFVGSFLRPQALKDAVAGHQSGTTTSDQLRKAQDDAIRDLVALMMMTPNYQVC